VETPDEAAVAKFIQEDYERVVNAVVLVAGSLPAAQDAVQEALARAWIRSRQGEQIGSLATWVTVVAMNQARSGWRRILAERRAIERANPRRGSSHDADLGVDVRRAVASLPRRQREVAVLRYLLDMSTRDVAEALGVGEGTVKNSLAKARAALAASLDVEMEAGTDVEDR